MFQSNFDEKTKTWSGADIPPLYNPNISIAHVLLRSMKLFGSKIAQISDDTGAQLTFKELRTKTVQAAQNLQKLGYRPKQVIGLMAANSAFVAPIAFASFCLGCPLNALDPSAEKETVLRMLRKTEPSVMFCDVGVYDLVKECLTELGSTVKIFTFEGTRGHSEHVESLFKETGTEESFIPVNVDGINDAAVIACSSGTTGANKGVCLSHAVLTSVIVSCDILTSDDIFFNNSSLYWISGLTSLLICTLSGATRIITAQLISCEKYLNILEKHEVTAVGFGSARLAPTLKSEAISKTNLNSIKHFLIGGAIVPLHITKKLDSYLPNGSANNAYGCTEMGGVFTIDFPRFTGIDTSGQLIAGCTFKIVDDEGNRCGVGMEGEICAKNQFKFLGYYRDQALTDQVVDSEGFFHTGDIGKFDENGNLSIVGRKKDLLGYPCYILPYEIEELLIKSHDIDAVCVVGIPYEVGHEVPAAVIVRAKNSQITAEEVSKMVEDNLVDRYLLRGGVYFVDSIPTTPSGKIIRRMVRETATELFNAKKSSVDFKPNFNYKM